ncbi:MAG: RecX family transcriptional regulator [Cytophagales bacterium]|nr:MAG: RecX family transcriptional regulator [Cytophagales bacterium]TAF60249.1 MAG: RecX family transcriptional regulator [Cytophagales bacterium]
MWLKKEEGVPSKTPQKALSLLMRWCAIAERAESDAKAKLRDWQMSEEDSQKIIAFLVRENFLNNERFLKSYVHDKVKLNRWGHLKIEYMLKLKGFKSLEIRKALQSLPSEAYEEALLHVLKTKFVSIKQKKTLAPQQKIALLVYARSRGFSQQLAFSLVDRVMGGKKD